MFFYNMYSILCIYQVCISMYIYCLYAFFTPYSSHSIASALQSQTSTLRSAGLSNLVPYLYIQLHPHDAGVRRSVDASGPLALLGQTSLRTDCLSHCEPPWRSPLTAQKELPSSSSALATCPSRLLPETHVWIGFKASSLEQNISQGPVPNRYAASEEAKGGTRDLHKQSRQHQI